MTPPGARWITVHPSGDEHEGRPVLIKDDGSGTVLGGMGGTFNGQKLGSLYRKDDGEGKPAEHKEPEPPTAEQQPEAEPSSEEAHPKYNPHLPDYEDLGPEMQAHVYGVPAHQGEGRGWQFHLHNPHLEAMSNQGYGQLAGGLLLPHKDGGVVYHQHADEGDAHDYLGAVHGMALDVAGRVHEHLGREHERRMRDEQDKAYQEEANREQAAWTRTQHAAVRKAITGFGGIARFKDKDAKGRRYMDAEYEDYVPKWARNQSGLTPDRARHALNEAVPHLELETVNDLFDYLDSFEDERAAFRQEQGEQSRAKAWAAEERRTARATKRPTAAAREVEGENQTMPYDSTDDLPDAAKEKLSAHQQEVFRKAFNNALQEYGDESKAYAVAWAAAKKSDGDESESREALTPAQQERPVRESTVQPVTVRENITREGRGYRIKDCQIMAAGPGNSLMGNTYLPEAVQALVPEIKRQGKAFLDHSLPSEVRERGHRSLRDLAGVYDKRTVRYDPQTQACLADLIVRPSVYDEYVAPVLEAGDNLGISVDGIGHCPDRPRHVKGWKRFNSADLVPAGGARGFIVREANSPAEKAAEKEFSMAVLDDITAADVRESAPALFEDIGRQYATAHALVREADAGTRASGPPPDDGRLNALETRVREAEQRAEAADARVYELEAERNRAAVAAFVDATVRECGVTEDKQAAFVARRFAGATMGAEGTYADQESLEAAVREAADEFKAVLPAPSSGQIVGLGSGTSPTKTGFTAPKPNDAGIVTATDWLFGAPSVVTQAAPGANGSGQGA